MGRRGLVRALATLAAAATGAVLLSGSGQPVTAHPYPHWQELTPPPFAPRVHALAVHVGPRVLVLGGTPAAAGPGRPALRDGAAYDLRTGRWRHLRLPVALSDRDRAATAAGAVFVQHAAARWRYDLRRDAWSRMRHLPPALSAPSAFRSELYALSRGRVVVFSVQLGRWTRLPADPLRPTLRTLGVSASRQGTVVTGYAGRRHVADRWDGVRWRRTSVRAPAPRGRPSAETRLEVGGRTFVVRGDRAWIRLP